MIEINPVPVQIGSVWYYEKVNCHTWERYISVNEYRRRYSTKIGNKNSTKPIIVYDLKEKTCRKFTSFKEAQEHTGVHRVSIWEFLHLPHRKVVNKRYKFSLTEIDEETNDWEYSNKNFNGED